MFARVIGFQILAALSISAASLSFSQFPPPGQGVQSFSNGTIGLTFNGTIFVGSLLNTGPNQNVLYSVSQSGMITTPFGMGTFLSTGQTGDPHTDEHGITSSPGLGGFTAGDFYVGNGSGIVHLSANGSTNNTFVTGLVGSVRSVMFDTMGNFGFGLVVTTDAGKIYKINSAGVATLLTTVAGAPIPKDPNFPADVEALAIAPNGFGSFGGQLILGRHDDGKLFAYDGVTLTPLSFSVPDPESVIFVPSNLNVSGSLDGYYLATYPGTVYKANASQFAGFQGDALIPSEGQDKNGNIIINRVHWNSGTQMFEVTQITGPAAQFGEDGIFVTTTPEPGTLGLLSLGAGLIGLGAWRRRNRLKK